MDTDDFVALLLDEKTFAEDAMVIALKITVTGEKVIPGFVQTATENETVCAVFLRELGERGLQTDQGLPCVIDGAKGLRARRSRLSPAPRRGSNAVSGISGRTSSSPWPKVGGSSDVGSFRRPARSPPIPGPRPPCSLFARRCGS